MRKKNGNRFKDKFLRNPIWVDGFKAFHYLLNKPLMKLYLLEPEGALSRLSRKQCCKACEQSFEGEEKCELFLKEKCSNIVREATNDTPRFVSCPHDQQCCILPLIFKKRPLGFIVICEFPLKQKNILQLLSGFHYFIKSRIENIFKDEEIEAIYENLHPRALAMSTMHTVHRIISSSLHIDDLLPRLTRFTFQVLKADYSAIFLLDDKKKFLVKRFETGDIDRKGVVGQKRIRVDTGIYGKMASVGNFHYSQRTIAVPLIEDDVIGIIIAMCHRRKKTFTKVDLEILRTVSEQAVIAIKNAQLFEHHERITKASVESISNLIDINTTPESLKYAEIFSKFVFEMAKELDLSAVEQKNILLAAKLLNTGHLGISEQVRSKREPLSQREVVLIKKHPFKAVEIIKSIESLKPIVPIILYHHEQYDGTGYPHGLKGEEIPLTVRIISLVMAFVAMISYRPYRKAKNIENALDEINSLAGSQFDPKVVAVFNRIMKRKEIKNLLKEHDVGGWTNGRKKTKTRNTNRNS